MNTKKITFITITPVLFSFFVMSFCDLVGIGVDNAMADFQLSNIMAQLIPSAVFVWFFFLSVSIGVLQDRIGKRNMVNIGMLVTAAGLLLPYFYYSFPLLLAGFVLLGIGNTILQVSANPLLIDVSPSGKSASLLSFSQFIKSIGSMVAPFIASYFALRFGNWKLVFLLFGLFSIFNAVWLHFTKVEESQSTERKATFGSAFGLLNTPFILLMALGIFFVVAIDVGINSTSGQFLMEKLNIDPEPAKQGRSLYFFGKMLGTFVGAILLTKLHTGKFLIYSSIATLITILAFIFSPSSVFAFTLMFLIGFAASNIFPLIFVITVNRYPKRSNEISGLMIMAVSGGAFIPPLVGKISDISNVTKGMYVFVGCAIYLLFVAAFSLRKISNQ
ncbi:MAG TPA: MFS transporter [Bacteroidales bacterium]|nr:MAG: putative transporter [Bacteroidetes bacterium ADurb.Bin041]HNV49720.1 MFS transporter [Bacteroidales bacterium]HPW42245.1 MFS transporter [Bacteroidales bacterium]HQH14257.1 MFS transporter [Bacteroidales bacterium]